MAVLRSNLPVAAQPWGRDVDNRLGNLEINVTKTLINTAANDSQFKASLDATNKTITKLDAVVANIYTPGTDSINASKITSGTLSAIDITGVNITGSTIVGTTYKSAATGQRIEITSSLLNIYDEWGTHSGGVYGSRNLMTGDSVVVLWSYDLAQINSNTEIWGTLNVTNSATIQSDIEAYANVNVRGTIKASQNNATGGGIWIGDDGDIVDLNDGYASMRFSNGVRIFSGNKTGTAVISFYSNGNISTNGSITSSNYISTSNDIYSRDAYISGSISAGATVSCASVQSDSISANGGTSYMGRSGSTPLILERYSAGGGTVRITEYQYNGTVVGRVDVTTTSTAYITSSDYRLKENITPISDAIKRLMQLKPSRFNFIAEPDKIVDGFIAHEVQEVIPEAISGEKDAIDENGNPDYQGIDQSKMVPLLTAALQDAIKRIEALENK